jgi:RHS repeat-associated protein
LYDDEGKLIEVRSEDDFDSANPVLAGKVAYAYDSQDRLIRICLQYTDSNSPTYYYQITYDEQGRMESVLVNQTSLMTYVYEDESGSYSDRVSSQTYGNLDVISFVYDDSGRVTQVNYQLYGETTPTARYAYEYDAMGNVNVITTWDPTQPNADPTREFYAYDASGRVIMITDTEGNTIEYGYDENGNVAELSFLIDGSTTSTLFSYNDFGAIESTLVNSVSTNEIVKSRTYETIALKRLESISLVVGIANPTLIFTQSFEPDDFTNRILEVNYDINSLTGIDYKFAYLYDELGNITEESFLENNVLQTKHNYEYDVMNQLVVEDIWIHSEENEPNNDYSYVYTYDSRGNRTSYSRFEYQEEESADYTLSYTYSQTWLDQMTSNGIMVNGTPITQNYLYDAQGNPTSITNFYYFDGTFGDYYDHATLAWDARQLAKIEIYNASQEFPANLVSTIVYTYNDQGYRTSKTITNSGQSPVVTTYDLLESQVIHESNGTDEIFFSYDMDGSLISFNLNGEDYFCITNQLGDIVALVDENRVEVAAYGYDAYGNLISTTGSIESPITYRGYRYDGEIGMFYLNSRYYQPQTGRFLNSDGLLGEDGDILSTNIYAYCFNNPILSSDETGESPTILDINGRYTGLSKCIEGIINLILVASLMTFALINLGKGMISVGLAGQIFTLNLSSAVTIPLILVGFLIVTSGVIYGTMMVAEITRAIAYTAKFKTFEIVKSRKFSQFFIP